jgi:predicted nucleic acid-binding protein
MIYLDTGCLVKLSYPEPDSSAVVSRVSGRPVFFTPLHELELSNALNLMRFRKQASEAQVIASMDLVQADLGSGVLVAPPATWQIPFQFAAQLAMVHSPTIGCRSLDILHCASAADLQTVEFVTTDERQSRLAQTMRLPWRPH